jgi:AmmeMemoRadiSam system protein A
MNDGITKGDTLTGLARSAIARKLGLSFDEPETVDADWLQEKAATFVTLQMHGNLRGCIGTLEAHRSLIEDVRANAVAAAFHDSRFAPLNIPLNIDEFAHVQIEVSVLSVPEPMHAQNEAIACSRLRPGIDGVVIKFGSYKATFLPQVWDQLPEPKKFMAHLKVKAGLPADFWHPEVLLYKYQVNKYREHEDVFSE